MIYQKQGVIDVTTGLPRWLIGLIRLSTVAFVIAWIGWATYGIIDNAKRNQWLVTSQFNPNASEVSTLLPSRDSWPMITATKEFLALSPEQRVGVADSFYAKKVSPIADGLHFDETEVRNWFLNSANQSLQDAPIRSMHSKLDNTDIQYRNYSNFPNPKLFKAFFNIQVFEVAGITVIALWVLIAFLVGIYKTVVWVIHGFKGRN